MDAPTSASVPATTNIPVDISTAIATTTNVPTETSTQDATPTADCNICTQMQSRYPMWKQSGLSKTCVLCNKPYCSAHAAPANKAAGEDVCEINHQTYYRKHPHRRAEGIFPTLQARKGKMLALSL